MTLRQLEILTRVGSRLNLTAAAQDLRIAQPSISVQLRLLEQQVGAKLYSATSRGIELTPAGAALMLESEQILSQIENLKLAMRHNFADAKPVVLSVGGTETPSTTCLPMLFSRFRKTHGDVQLQLRTADGWTLAKLVLSGDLDLALVRRRVMYHRLAAEPFDNDAVVACVSSKHPLAKAKERCLTNEALSKFGIVARHTASGMISYMLIETLKRRGLRNAFVVMECDSAGAKVAAIKSQIGIGLVPRSTIQDDLRNREVVELALPGRQLYLRSYIVYDKTRPLSPVARDFLLLLRNYRSELKKKCRGSRRRSG